MTSPHSACETKAAVPPGHDRLTVLIVGSDALLRDSYWFALQEAGCQGVAAAEGDRVLEVMYTENVSVVLLDLFGPRMDGIETLKTIKRVSPETLVVAIGHEASQRDMADQLGADAFVLNSASPAAIMGAVTGLTSQGSIAANPAERRRYTRLKVDSRGYLYNPPNGKPLPCRIADLSAGGALIQSQSECPRDRALVLHIEGFGNFEGVVVHNQGGATGFKFLMGELKRDRLKQALASFAKTGKAPIATYGVHPNFKPGATRPRPPRPAGPDLSEIFPYT